MVEELASSAAEAAAPPDDDRASAAVDVRITANTKIRTCVAFAVEVLQVRAVGRRRGTCLPTAAAMRPRVRPVKARALSLLQAGPEAAVRLTGVGRAISKTVTICEIVKRRVAVCAWEGCRRLGPPHAQLLMLRFLLSPSLSPGGAPEQRAAPFKVGLSRLLIALLDNAQCRPTLFFSSILSLTG